MVAQFETSIGFATKKGSANFYFRGGVYYNTILSDLKKLKIHSHNRCREMSTRVVCPL